MSDFELSKWPYFDKRTISAATEVLKTGVVNYRFGSKGRLFEKSFCDLFGCGSGVAVSNGTVALEACMLALGIGVGDEVIVPSRSFVASAMTVVKVGATPIFADIEYNSQCIDWKDAEAKITANTKAILVVHFGGFVANMKSLVSLADAYGLDIIEDCAQAHGGMLDGQSVGTFGRIAAWSFCSDKIISTAGEGGMVTSLDDQLLEVVRSMKDHGKNLSRDVSYSGQYEYIHDYLGSNWRITELQAAVGLVQVEQVPEWSFLRRRNMMQIWDAMRENTSVIIPEVPNNQVHAAYKGYFFVPKSILRPDWSRDRICAELNSVGIPASQGGASELYVEKVFAKYGLASGYCSVSKMVGAQAVAFPVHPNLVPSEVEYMCDKMILVLDRAQKPKGV